MAKGAGSKGTDRRSRNTYIANYFYLLSALFQYDQGAASASTELLSGYINKNLFVLYTV